MNNKKVQAVVVTYNRKKLLIRCLESLCSQQYKLDKIIIVDNASIDDTYQVVDSYKEKYPRLIHYIKLPTNIGGAGGFSVGFETAIKLGADWILIMDDDAAPCSDYISILMKYAERYPEVGCLIGTEYVGYSDRIAYGGRRRIVNPNSLFEAPVSKSEYKKPFFFIDSLTFVGPLIHRDIIKKSGYPDKNFFIYFDDTDYSFRMRKYTKIMHVTDAKIIHRTNFDNDIIEEGKKEWRRFYRYRNDLVVKKRYIANPFYKVVYILKTFLNRVYYSSKSIWKEERKISTVFRNIYLKSRATVEVCFNKLGKAKYIHYDR